MYDSPIRLAVSKMTSKFNDDIYNAVVKTGIDVDKDELVRALNYDRNQYEKGYRDGLKASEWISVKDRLPENKGRYIIYVRGPEPFVSWFDGYRFRTIGITPFVYPATHWMPLPQPPKEEETCQE